MERQKNKQLLTWGDEDGHYHNFIRQVGFERDTTIWRNARNKIVEQVDTDPLLKEAMNYNLPLEISALYTKNRTCFQAKIL